MGAKYLTAEWVPGYVSLDHSTLRSRLWGAAGIHRVVDAVAGAIEVLNEWVHPGTKLV